jgi:hypothetical protein
MAVPYTKTATSISLVVNFTSTVIPKSHPNFDKIAELVADPNTTEAELTPLLDIPAAISTFTGGNVTVVNGRLFYKGFEVKGNLAKVILDFVKSGQPEAAKPFEMFLEKAFQNPDPRAAADLYDWVAASGLPITPNGDILAWKIVGSDYFSLHSGANGKLRHRIGDMVREDRHLTDADPNRTCSRGVHFCSAAYLPHYGTESGNRVMAVTISPTDVVAFPKDYGLAKGRCCQLTVVGEVTREKAPTFYEKAGRTYDWKADSTIRYRDRWINRAGETVVIAGTSCGGDYPIKDTNGRRYTKNGYFNDAKSTSQFDLVRRA